MDAERGRGCASLCRSQKGQSKPKDCHEVDKPDSDGLDVVQEVVEEIEQVIRGSTDGSTKHSCAAPSQTASASTLQAHPSAFGFSNSTGRADGAS